MYYKDFDTLTENMTEDTANQAAEAHLETYCSHFRICIGKLRSIWRQVGNESDECRSQVMVAADQALAAWTQAVERAEAERLSIKALIQQHSSEIASIKAELDDGAESQSSEPDMSNVPGEGEATLLRTLDALKGTLQFWRVKRASRMQAYEALMDIHLSLKRQLGLRHELVEDIDISTGALEYLQMENGKLLEDKGRRISRAEDLLDKLRAVCRELGEDSATAAAEVHPALSSLSAEKESAEVLGVVYKLVGSPSHLTAGGDLDLSDGMFERLSGKIADMQRLKTEREAQSRDVLEMLGSLWDALSIPEDAPERSMVAKMLSPDRPQRLHKRTLDKCLAEVNRLEGCKAQAMRDLALAKARELEQLCISTRISPPHTGPLLAELDRPGQMTQVLSKLVRLVAEVHALAAKRAPILTQVSELLAAQADSAWLRSYNQNENRYKGRDASRNMQRAIKAAKLRERLAPMMEALLTALAEWELEEGGPFLYDEQVLQETQLRVVEAELEQLTLEKAPKPKAALPSSVAGDRDRGAATSGKPPAGGRPTPGPSRPAAAPATSSSGAPAGRGAAASVGGASAASSGSTTPRSVTEAVRRMSFGTGTGTSSARDTGMFRGNMTTAAQITGRLMRSNDFAPGTLRAIAQQATAAAGTASTSAAAAGAAASSEAMTAPHQNQNRLNVNQHPSSNAPAHTPLGHHGRSGLVAAAMASPGVPALSPAGAATSAVGVSPSPMVSKAGVAEDGGDDVVTTASGVKNPAQDLFRRYLGDASDVTSKPTPSKVASASPKPARLSFSTGASGGGGGDADDGADDVRATKCDTPKSTATSRAKQQHQQQLSASQLQQKTGKTPPNKSGSTVFSPSGEATSKPSRIPRVRM